MKHLFKWMQHEGSTVKEMKGLFDDVDEGNRANIILALLLAYNTRIWGNLQSKAAMKGFDPKDWEDTNSPECRKARMDFEAEIAKTGNDVNVKLN